MTKIDNIKAYISINKESPLYGLSSNSNVIMIDDDTHIYYDSHLSQATTSRYFTIQDVSENQKLGFIIIDRAKKGAVEFRDVVEITGMGCMLRDLMFYVDIFLKMSINILELKRLDLCRDYPGYGSDFQKLLADLVAKNQITHTPITTNAHGVETLYIGAHKNNDYKKIRIYNKVLDTIVKGKAKYFNFQNTDKCTRIEIEYKKKKLIDFKFSDLFNQKLLDDMFDYDIKIRKYFKGVSKKQAHRYRNFFHSLTKGQNVTQDLQKILKDEREANFQRYNTRFKSNADELRAFSTAKTAICKLLESGYDYTSLIGMLNAEIAIYFESWDRLQPKN